MLNFITGPKGSGKTEKAHEILGERVKCGENAMLIVPKQFTFESDKGILHLLGPRLACEVEVLSFTRLSHIALEKYGGITKPILQGGSRLIMMSLALEAVKDKLRVFAKHTNEISLVTKLLQQIDEMKQSGVEPEELEKAAESLKDKELSRKINEIALVYRSFQAVVSESWFDDADLLKRVYEILSVTDFFKDKTIAIDGFSSFSFYEIKLIELMISKAKNVYITLCSDDITDTGMLSAFSHINTTARKLRLMAGNMGADMGEIISLERKNNFSSCDISYLHDNLYSPLVTPYTEKSKNVCISTCANPQQECDNAARKIKQFIRKGEYRCRDIAVVYRSGAVCIPLTG